MRLPTANLRLRVTTLPPNLCPYIDPLSFSSRTSRLSALFISSLAFLTRYSSDAKDSASGLFAGWRSTSTGPAFGRVFTTATGNHFFSCRAQLITKPIQLQIVDALRMGERSKAFSLLLDLGKENYPLRDVDFVYILNYCTEVPNPLIVFNTWNIMVKRDISMDNVCSSLMLLALCKGGCLDEAFRFINLLKENHGIYHDLAIYNHFLRACSEMQSLFHANQCLDLMEQRMVGKNKVTYMELLELAVCQKNLSAVHNIWKDYIKYYGLSIRALRKFIWSFSRLGDRKSAYETLQKMIALVISRNTSLYIPSLVKIKFSTLDIPIPSICESGTNNFEFEENGHFASSLYSVKLDTDASNKLPCDASGFGVKNVQTLRLKGLHTYEYKSLRKSLRQSFNYVMRACAKWKDCEMAEQLSAQMQNLGIQPSSRTWDGFVRAIVFKRGFTIGIEVLNIMRDMNLKPYDSTLAALSTACSKGLELNLAEYFLDQLSGCSYPYPFNAFLAACDSLDRPERAVRIFSRMKQLNIVPDIWTYELLFSLFGNVNAPYESGNILSQADAAKRIHAIRMDMEKHNIDHSSISMKNLLKALGAEGMIEEMFRCLHVAENLFSRNNTELGFLPIYNIVLHSLVEVKQVENAIAIFKNMKSRGILPNDITYTIMIDSCSILKCSRSAYALVSMMFRDGFFPQRSTYTAIIKVLLEDDNVDEALNLLDKACSERIKLDVLLFNTILRKAYLKEMIDLIESVVERMHVEKIRPDVVTCNYVFSAYVDHGFHNTAIEALQVLSMRMLCKDDGSLPDKTEFEDLLLAEDTEAESRILELFKDYKDDLAFALLNLRWSELLGFSVSWSPDQSPWARRLSNTYGSRMT